MRRIFLTLIGLITLIAWVNAQETLKSVSYIPDRITRGQPLTVIYRNDMTVLAGKESIEGVVYYYKDYVWYGNDLQMRKTDTAWIAEITVPTDAALTAFKFAADGISDTGGEETYVQFTVNETGQNIPSAFTGWGLLRGASSVRYSIPEYFTDTTNQIPDNVLLFWYNQTLKLDPSQRRNIWFYAAQTMDHLNHFPENAAIRADIDFVLSLDSANQADEEDLLKCITAARRFLRNDSLASVIESLVRAKFPNGIMARDDALYRIFRISDLAEKENELEKLLKRFPAARFVDIETENTGLYYGKIFQSVIYNRIVKNNDYSLLERYIHDVPYEFLATFFWHIVQIPYRDNLMTAKQLFPHAQLIIDEIFMRQRRMKMQVYSPKEWHNKLLSDNKAALLAWSKILDETGSTDESFAWMQQIAPFFEGKSSDFSDFYMLILEKTGRSDLIRSVVESGVKENAASPKMLEWLKKNYQGDDFETYVATMKEKSKIEEQQAEINKHLINSPIQLFELENLSGEKVDMSAKKGKIMVLDFWATWCAPCKAAMPGMQMAVEKYKSDNQVEFYFISTMETDPKYKQKIHDFLNEKKYDFNVLLDRRRDDKHQDLVYSTYAAAFHFSGIPQKMIIDGNGNLRWRSTGYGGSPSALVDEISFVIELLKKESKL
ncbi:MAG: TlpA family protein disulfide reductase [Dysgonamonadaceae bacterium]|jgi:thiol-disulfide isomerase/thioredoxin|nr:TlpA family protein disulfide reductase [Dysgonamonadaceae bacterium]